MPVLIPVLAYRRYLGAINPSIQSQSGSMLIHAASVGEMNALRALISSLRHDHPDREIIITNTNINALGIGPAIDSSIRSELAVLDVFHLRYRQLSRIKPKLICIMETEIWPNLLLIARLKRIPIVFLNARMTAKSLVEYQHFAWLIRFASKSVEQINCQSQDDAMRFKEIFDCAVAVSGNLKFCPKLPHYDSECTRTHWNILPDSPVIVFGSSRPGEEELILKLWPALKLNHPSLRLLIAPRHLSRMAELEKLFSGIAYSRESQEEEVQDIHVIDKLGLLNQAYSICDLAIVGGSFFDFGGHNPLEPAFYGKAIIMGKYHKSCRDSVDRLLEAKAILLSNQEDLPNDIESLLDNAMLRGDMGNAAQQVLKQNSLALERHMESIKAWL
ncbi:MAG TPA: glycosyltransferase N-terminal domain-containing protein [Candidatus Cloacimonadota bacterium]|nr:glycosyltransferase N-terminal domain-containing protein [Candidatus Cloacimonadota bacterium]